MSQTEVLGPSVASSRVAPQPCAAVAGDLARPLLGDCLNIVMQPIPSLAIQSCLNFQSRIRLTQVAKLGYEAVNAMAHRELNIIRQVVEDFLSNTADPQAHVNMLSDFLNVRGVLSPDYILSLLNSPNLATVRCAAALVEAKHFQKTDLIGQAIGRVMGHPEPQFQLLGLELAYCAPIDHPIRYFANLSLDEHLPVDQQLAILEGFEQECVSRPEHIPELCLFLASNELDEDVRDAAVQALNNYFEFGLHIGSEIQAYDHSLDVVIGVIRHQGTSPRVRFDLFSALGSAVPEHPDVLALVKHELLTERLSANTQNEFSLNSLIVKNLRVMSNEAVGYLVAQVNTLLLDAVQVLMQPLDLNNLDVRIAAYKIVAVAAQLGDSEALEFVKEHVNVQTFRDFEQWQIVAPDFHAQIAYMTNLAVKCLHAESLFGHCVYFKARHILRDSELTPSTRAQALGLLSVGSHTSSLAKLLLTVFEDAMKPDDCAIFHEFDASIVLLPSTKMLALGLCVTQLRNSAKSDEDRISALRFLGQYPDQVAAHHSLLKSVLLNPYESRVLRSEVATFVNAYLLIQRCIPSTLSELESLILRLESEGTETALQCAKYMKLNWIDSIRVWDNEVLAELGDPNPSRNPDPNLDQTPGFNLRWAFLAIERCSRLPSSIWNRLQLIALDPNQPEWLRTNAMKVTLKFRPEGVSPEPFWAAAINSGNVGLGRVAVDDMDKRLSAILR
ncbi:MAG: hypothetical protein QE278_14705 [Limnobacter sp.]|nr:hypothetical protein [Limnobacter sp.]